GNKKAEGNGKMKELLGGKGANLAEMNLIGIPVPGGFTITTEVCTEYYEKGEQGVIDMIRADVEKAMTAVENEMGTKFADTKNPLLVSVRSGARVSMPGMMDTILNLGLNDQTVESVAKNSGNARFAWDSYRRFVQMYGDVVMGMKPESKEDEDPFEEIIDSMKAEHGYEQDTEFTSDDLKVMVDKFKVAVKKQTGKDFPADPWDQLWGAICAVFESWMNPRACLYRQMHKYPAEWGTAVNVQAMVFGNMGDNSATGVAFTRDASTGENIFNGEYLVNAQGEDVVAGIRTPQEITIEGSRRWATLQGVSEADRKAKYPSLEEVMPVAYKELFDIQNHLEKTFTDMQDIEFTIQDGKLWMLQTRSGKRTGAAMVRMAVEMMGEGLIDEKTAVLRVEPAKLDELLHPVFDTQAIKQAKVLAKGLPASPGAASGQLVFFADDAAQWADDDKKTILVRIETSPEDLKGMNAAEGILTARGGMTSHAAVVARGMGKCCVSGAGGLAIDYKARTMTIGTTVLKEGDWISLNGSTGEVYQGKVGTMAATLSGDFAKIMELAKKYAHLKVRANADTPHDAKVAFDFGAQGIGLCRTEHMFFEGDRIKSVREMILADDEDGRRKALAKLLPIQRGDFEGLFEAMGGHPVTVRLLDPPLHEFVPHFEKEQRELAADMDVSFEKIKAKIEYLAEVNPMLGHRGCRLGNTYPEITEMQARAIMEAAMNVKKKGLPVNVEIMVPLVGNHKEFKYQKAIIDRVAEEVFAERNDKLSYMVGTMIEVPRAAVTANEIAEMAEFFSFGTNDLTQMTLGFSRDDISKFLPTYLEKGIIKQDPFQVLDVKGVGELVREAVFKGRGVRQDLKCGICGEHGGDPTSVEFCHYAGLNYVSCSPFRVPIAQLAAAHAAIKSSTL
ncbi:MAG: pyruvate, phosphate dikinase, partial [Mucinivorans sp.]